MHQYIGNQMLEQQNYMLDKIHLEDEVATLNLAHQIGLKANCSPYLSMPPRKEKFSNQFSKMLFRYIENRSLVLRKKQSPKKERNKDLQNIRELEVSQLQTRKVMSSQQNRRSVQEEQARAQTARRGEKRKSFLITKKVSVLNDEENPLIRENKKLLFNIWEQEKKRRKQKQPRAEIKNKIVFHQVGQKSILIQTQKKKEKDVRLKFNIAKNKFQFS